MFLIADIYERVSPPMQGLGLNTDCVGGGRIQHNRQEKCILVYGYSIVRTTFIKKLFYYTTLDLKHCKTYYNTKSDKHW